MIDFINKKGGNPYENDEDYKHCLAYSKSILKGDDLPYTELTYIQSTGTQFINTLYKPTSKTKVEAEIETINLNNTFVPFGVRTNNNYDFIIGINFNNKNYIQFYSNDAVYSNESSNNLLNTKLIVSLENTQGKIKLGNNTTILISFPERSSFTSPSNLYLGCLNNSNSTSYLNQKYKIFKVKIWENNLLVRDFIPVKHINGTICLYEKLSNTYYYNAGTGNFLPGEEV